MTVANQNTKITYLGNGINRIWSFNFPLCRKEDMSVYITSEKGIETKLDGSFYIDEELLAVVYPTQESELAPLPSGYSITLKRETPLTQSINLLRHAELDAEVLEAGYDRATMQLQEVSEAVSRAIKFPLSAAGEGVETEEFLQKLSTIQEQVEVQLAQGEAYSQNAKEFSESAQQSASYAEAQAEYIAELAQSLEFPADDTLSNVVSIAPQSAVAQQLALKADNSAVAQALQAKADKTELASKADMQLVEEAISTKADKNEVVDASLSTLSGEGKNIITGLNQPDFTADQSLIKDVVFQAPSDGYIYRSCGQASHQGLYIWAADNVDMQNLVEISHVDASVGHYSSWHFARKGWFYKVIGGGTPWLVVFYPVIGARND